MEATEAVEAGGAKGSEAPDQRLSAKFNVRLTESEGARVHALVARSGGEVSASEIIRGCFAAGLILVEERVDALDAEANGAPASAPEVQS